MSSAFWLVVLATGHVILLLAPAGSWLQGGAVLALMLLPGLIWGQVLLPATERLSQWLAGAGLAYTLVVGLGMLLTYLPGPISLPLALLLLDGLALWGCWYLKSPGDIALPRLTPGLSLLLVLLALAAVFYLGGLGYSEFQEDEGEVMLSVARALNGEQDALFAERRKGPAEMILPLLVWSLSGRMTELLARLPFAVAGLLLVLTTYQLGRQVLNNEAAGLIGAALVTLNGFMVAFSRIVQYQILVMWLGALALLCLWHWRQTQQWQWAVMTGLVAGTGILAHYDGLLVLPALAYLLLWHHDRWAALQAGLVVGGSALAILGPFYGPYVLSAQASTTGSYLAQRIGTAWLNNTLPNFLHYSIFYTSFYYLLITGLLLLGYLTLRSVPVLQRLPGGRYWLPVLVLVMLAYPTALQLSPTLDLALLPFGLLLAGTFFSPQLDTGSRAILMWLAATFLGYNFGVARPQTHIYIIFPPWTLLAALGAAHLWAWTRDRLSYRVGVAGVAMLLVMLFSGFVYQAYLRQDARYWQQPSTLFWAPAPYHEPPTAHIFGFVHRTGWKAIGGLYDSGYLNGSYYSNESGDVTGWYTRNAPRRRQEQPPNECHLEPRYYFVAAEFFGAPNRIDPDRLAQHYTRVGHIDWGAGIDIYERIPPQTVLPEILDARHLINIFDQTTRPPAFEIAPPQTYALQANLNNQVQLTGYRLDAAYAHPGGHLTLTLQWQVLAAIDDDWVVFVQVLDESGAAPVGQSNSRPVCGYYPTPRWQPGQTIPDQHILHLSADTVPGTYQLWAGLYQPTTNVRMPVLTGDTNPTADAIELGHIQIQE